MPYLQQVSSFQPVIELAKSKLIQKELGDLEEAPRLEDKKVIEVQLMEWGAAIEDLAEASAYPIDKVISLDGSSQTTQFERGVAGATLNYITYAAIVTDIKKYKELAKQRIIDPVAFRAMEDRSSRATVLPGENILVRGCRTTRDSFRKKVYELFENPEMSFLEKKPLAEVLDRVVAHTEKSRREGAEGPAGKIRCPHDTGHLYEYSRQPRPCPVCKETVYPTDWLRLHENIMPSGAGTGEAIGGLGQVMEHLTAVGILQWMEEENILGATKHYAIIIDGPLAIFGTAAELHRGIQAELKRINRLCVGRFGHEIAMVGISKTGAFVGEFERIDTFRNGAPNRIKGGRAILLGTRYINTRVVPSRDSTKEHGEGTYYSEKILYKTKSNMRLALTIPRLSDAPREPGEPPEAKDIPRLQDILRLMEDTATHRYENAIGPVISAHNEASIPLNLGRKILEEMARKHIASR